MDDAAPKGKTPENDFAFAEAVAVEGQLGMELEAELPQTPPLPPPPGAAGAGAAAGGSEMRVAVFNALKLSLSLVGTLLVAIVIQFLIPRYVGLQSYGKISFAETYAASFFVFTTFGIDSYIRKEVSTRLSHANDFWAGFWLLRIASTLVCIACMAWGLSGMHKGALEWRLVAIFAVGQLVYVHNFTVAALLQAASSVNELSLWNVASKLLWGGGVWLGLVFGAPLEMVAATFTLGEIIKAVALSGVCRRKLNLVWRVDVAATWIAVLASMPYFLNYMANRTYTYLNVLLLSGMTDDSEVGWYNAASKISQMMGFFLPVLQAVLVPMAARLGKKDIEAMNALMRDTVRLVIVAGTLVSLLVTLHADTLALGALGGAFGESSKTLAVLGPMFVLTYLATLASMHLIQLDRIWTVVKVSIVSLVLSVVLTGPFIYWGYHWGAGWAGAMSAAASICTEALTAVITFILLGKAAVDRRLWRVLGMTALVCGSVTGLHYVTAVLGLWRVPLEIVVYSALALATGALPWADVRRTVENAVRSRRRDAGPHQKAAT